ncbi:hypothetical protein CFP56_029179 [Quercus suber]|uniref:Uncharacterized protein n=1 Tax=Quercus suber TaxID=58331 RepID=A0AAW0MC82_QUESU
MLMTNLSYLYLSNSGFAGHISIEISRLKRLKIENLNLATVVQNVSEFKQLYLDGVKTSTQEYGAEALVIMRSEDQCYSYHEK